MQKTAELKAGKLHERQELAADHAQIFELERVVGEKKVVQIPNEKRKRVGHGYERQEDHRAHLVHLAVEGEYEKGSGIADDSDGH